MSESLFCFVALFLLAVFLVQTHLYEEGTEKHEADAEEIKKRIENLLEV